MNAPEYTPEQLREWADTWETHGVRFLSMSPNDNIAILRAHAAALEELAGLRDALAVANRSADEQMRYKREAEVELAAVKAEREAFYMNYRMQCDAGQKAAEIRAEKAESALAQAERRGMERAAMHCIHIEDRKAILAAAKEKK